MMETPQPRKMLTPEQLHALRGSLRGRAMLEKLSQEHRLDREREEAKIARWLEARRREPRDGS